MLFCTNCGNELKPNDGFCRNCGTPVPVQNVAEPAPAEPTYTPPVYTPPAYTPPTYTPPAYTPPAYTPPAQDYNNATNIPVYEAEPVVAPKAKALGYVSMGLGIGGLVLAVVGLLYTLLSLELEGMGFAMALVFGVFSLPCAILAKIFRNKAEEGGNFTSPPSVGGKLGLAGIIVSAVMLFFGFISLMII